MVLKPQSYINDFFIKNKGKEFINFDTKEFKEYFRINDFFIEEIIGIRGKSFGLKKIHSLLLKIQKIFLIKRNKNKKYYKGSNWFSISNSFARYVISKEKEIEKEYKYTFCADEIFLQTLIKNSEYAKNIYKNHEKNVLALRYIDWERGNPFTFKKNDYNLLINSSALFARKFSDKIDNDIVELIYKKVQEEE